MKEARFYERLPRGLVRCRLCPRQCRIRPGETGWCKVRRNDAGQLWLSSYGRVAAEGMDPVEKKPLYHFYPGSWIYSLSARGCNLRCRWCQNWRLSQEDGPSVAVPPATPVELVARSRRRGAPCVGLAFTYSEPLVWYEYVYDAARLARERGYASVLVTNGYVQEEPLRDLLPYVNAMNVDVKSWREASYRRWCGGQLAPVLRTVEIAAEAGCHIELTYLMIPDLNDSAGEVDDMVKWVAGLDRGIPLHLTRYFPAHKLDTPPTPISTLRRAAEQARGRLDYVYLGNTWEEGSDTLCPQCGTPVILREGHHVTGCRLRGHQCATCDREIRLVGQVLAGEGAGMRREGLDEQA
ncbi:MAG: AmmeMemoRadiSam system radical SAM enzyme [bacterium]|nr:AmmeMemoRadiSam system radical SAM enzyme [bacterium]